LLNTLAHIGRFAYENLEREEPYLMQNTYEVKETVNTNGMYRLEEKKTKELPYGLILEQQKNQGGNYGYKKAM